MPNETGSKIENITIRTTGAVSDELAVRFEAVVLAPPDPVAQLVTERSHLATLDI